MVGCASRSALSMRVIARPAVSHSAGGGGSAQNWWHRESRGIQHAVQASA